MTASRGFPAMACRFAQWVAPVLLGLTLVLPVTSRPIKLFQILLLSISLSAWLWPAWRRSPWRTLLLILLLIWPFCLPAKKQPDLAKLGKANVLALESYLGATYWWGGENGIGIDCSGLIRRGLMDASFSTGLYTLDGRLIRQAVDLWWHDCSAEALGEGYRGYTVPVTKARSINELDESVVIPGDMAIAGGGSHILAYLGEGLWIQADPNAGKVIVEQVPSDNGWFAGSVQIVRWRALEPPN